MDLQKLANQNPSNDVLATLLQAKRDSDLRRYKSKHNALRKLIKAKPEDYVIDSEERGIYGITHIPSGFKIHIPKAAAPAELQRAAQQRVRVALPYEGGYLMERLSNPKYPENIGKTRFPGGGIEKGETPQQAAVRELQEELGITTSEDQFEELGINPHGQHGEEVYLQLKNHGLAPGNYVATVGGDKNIELLPGSTTDETYWGADPSELGRRPPAQDDVYVHSAVPAGLRDLVKKHGLLSSQALLNNPEALKAFLGSRKGTDWEEDEEGFRKRVEEKLKDTFWGDAMKGPSVFFGEPDPEKITDVHPMRKLKSEMLRVNLSKLLRDHPKTRIAGSELQPYDPKGPEHQGDLRHYDIDLNRVREYAAMAPKELWQHYDEPEGTRYASNVPHAQLITPLGGIPPEYLEFNEPQEDEKQAGRTVKDLDLSEYLERYKLNDLAHGPQHVENVRRSAAGLSGTHAPGQEHLVDYAAALHDMEVHGGRDEHENRAADAVVNSPYFQENLSKRDLRTVSEAIRQHRSSTGRPRTTVAKIVSDADRLAEVDPAGALRRAISWGQQALPDLTEDEQILRAHAHLVEKYGPGGQARRLYFPESLLQLEETIKPILATGGDLEKIKALLQEKQDEPDTEQMAPLYHGSPTGELAQLEPRPHSLTSKPSIFAATDENLALSMALPSTDQELAMGYEEDKATGKKEFVIDELQPGKLSLLDAPAHIYDLPSATFSQQGAHPELMQEERISHEPVSPLRVRQVQSILQELRNRDVTIRPYDEVPKEKWAAVVSEKIAGELARGMFMGTAAEPWTQEYESVGEWANELPQGLFRRPYETRLIGSGRPLTEVATDFLTTGFKRRVRARDQDRSLRYLNMGIAKVNEQQRRQQNYWRQFHAAYPQKSHEDTPWGRQYLGINQQRAMALQQPLYDPQSARWDRQHGVLGDLISRNRNEFQLVSKPGDRMSTWLHKPTYQRFTVPSAPGPFNRLYSHVEQPNFEEWADAMRAERGQRRPRTA